jgi:hypothetical protein
MRLQYEPLYSYTLMLNARRLQLGYLYQQDINTSLGEIIALPGKSGSWEFYAMHEKE